MKIKVCINIIKFTTSVIVLLFFLSSHSVLAVGFIAPTHTSYISNNDFNPLVSFPEWNTISGNYLYSGSNIANAVTITDISNPSNPVQVGVIKNGEGGAKLISPKKIVIHGDYAYVSVNTTAMGDTIEVLNISDPTHPTHSGSIMNGDGGASITSVFLFAASGNYLYIGSYTDKKLEIIDISDPTHPVHAASLADTVGGAKLNGIYEIKIIGIYAYITNFGGDSFEILNISNPLAPVHVGSITNGTGGAKLDGASGFKIIGDYAYINSYASKALEILNISNPASPTHVASFSDTTNGARIYGYEIESSGNYVYLSSYLYNAMEVIDVSIPVAPVRVMTINDGDNGAILGHVRGMSILGDKMYISSSSSNAIEIMDISNPASPTHFSSINPIVYIGNPNYVKIYGDYAYILSTNSNALQVVNIRDPKNPTLAGSLVLRANGPQLYAPAGIDFKGNYGYIVSSGLNNGLGAMEVINITDPANPTHVSSQTGGIYASGAYGIKINGDYAYVAAFGRDTFEILDITSDPTNPTHVGSITHNAGSGILLDGCRGINIVGNYAYVVSSVSNSLEIIDITNPASPTHVGSITNGTGGAVLTSPRDVIVIGDYAYVISFTGNALEVLNISNPASPTHVSSYVAGSGGASRFKIIEDKVFVTSASSFEVADISNPLSITSVASISDGTNNAKLLKASGLDISGDYAYVVASDNSENALEIIRIKDSVVPVVSLNGNSSISMYEGDIYEESGSTANDDLDGNITNNILITNNVDTTKLGIYTVSYAVSDSSNNKSSVIERQVSVIKKPSPSSGSYVGGGFFSPNNNILVNNVDSIKNVLNTTIKVTTPSLEVPIVKSTSISKTLKFFKLLFPLIYSSKIKELQNYLNSHGYNTGKTDGIFGSKTSNAIIRFQKANNLKPDGVVGPKTMAAIGI